MPRLKQNITPLCDIILLPGDVADPTSEGQVQDCKIDRQLDELYADATTADRLLGRFINQVATDFPGCVAGIKSAPLKDRRTAKAKLTRGGASKGVEDLKDIARATITFKTEEAMYAARDYITRQRCFTSLDGVALKDRYQSVRQGGWVRPPRATAISSSFCRWTSAVAITISSSCSSTPSRRSRPRTSAIPFTTSPASAARPAPRPGQLGYHHPAGQGRETGLEATQGLPRVHLAQYRAGRSAAHRADGQARLLSTGLRPQCLDGQSGRRQQPRAGDPAL
ncbi:hypothetical protein [Marinobacterium aestuariivivens]|uniref:Uncharacterized protein n=1 Tax=Marinobacterium aestuariivivens TaxID=1698799 RepID=A0ABW1ZZV1_9GAMM